MKKILFFLLLLLPLLSTAQRRKKTSSADSSQPFALGEIRTLHSAALAEDRILNIFLPDGYRTDDTSQYPVIYLLDGSADEDYIHVAGLVHFNNFPWIDAMPKSILVGIANVDRKRDFSFPTTVAADLQLAPTGGHSDKFIAFIETELQPFLNQHYRTGPDRMLIGQSLGGLLGAEILLKKPQLFNRYALISPSVWWDSGSVLNVPLTMMPGATPVSVYIAVGKEGLTPTTPPRVMEVDANLLAEKLRREAGTSIDLYFDYLPEEDHAGIAHTAIIHAFKQFYRNRKRP